MYWHGVYWHGFGSFRGFVPDQFEPAAAVAVDGHGEQALAYKVQRQTAGENGQYAYRHGRERMRRQVQFVEQKPVHPKSLDRRMIVDQVNTESGPGQTINATTMEFPAREQFEKPESDKHGRDLPIIENEELETRALSGHGEDKRKSQAVHNLDTQAGENKLPTGRGAYSLHVPAVVRKQNKPVHEHKHGTPVQIVAGKRQQARDALHEQGD